MKNTASYISIATLCNHYKVELSFFNHLKEMGLIEITTIEEKPCLHEDRINDLEKIMLFHHDLNVNMEGIDVIFNLLNKIDSLQQELLAVRNRLEIFHKQ